MIYTQVLVYQYSTQLEMKIPKGHELITDYKNMARAVKKTTTKNPSGNGQAWSLPSPRGQRRIEKNGGNWL